jgi:hypothetical protein
MPRCIYESAAGAAELPNLPGIKFGADEVAEFEEMRLRKSYPISALQPNSFWRFSSASLFLCYVQLHDRSVRPD